MSYIVFYFITLGLCLVSLVTQVTPGLWLSGILILSVTLGRIPFDTAYAPLSHMYTSRVTGASCHTTVTCTVLQMLHLRRGW